MAGGIGSRFWPMSTPQHPKQFLDITGSGRTMIQQTFDRYKGIIDIDHLWVVTSENYRELVFEQLKGINPQHVMLEPCMRNTAPCIAYASWKINKEDPDAVCIIAPSDHLILEEDKFRDYVLKGLKFVEQGGRILTMGMKPSRPDTGYGYIEQGKQISDGIYKLQSFREKPDFNTAISYLKKGGFTWNSGMFLWKVSTIMAEIHQYAKEIADIMDSIEDDLFTDKEPKAVNKVYPTLPKISIDYAVMEKTKNAYVLPSEFGWSDVGTWGSLYTLTPHDNSNNAIIGNAVKMIGSEGCIVKMPADKQVVIEGLKNYIVSEYNDVLLICKLEDEQHIKEWHD